MIRSLTAALMLLATAFPLRAAPVDDLLTVLEIDQMLEIMREEGIAYGDELGGDLFGGNGDPRWNALLSQIYDIEKMGRIVKGTFADRLSDDEIEALLAFFSTESGQQIISLELEARRAMIDDTVEDAAREAFRDIDGTDAPRLGRIEAFVEANDLIEANVSGALNASYQFYRGLVDGGGLSISESEILSDVWAQEDDTREDTREWVYAYLMLAYKPLTDRLLEDYIDMSEAEAGRALNRTLFAGFNKMYDEISYALGLAAAKQMQGQDL